MADENKVPTLEEMAKQMEEAAKAKGAATPSPATVSPAPSVSPTPAATTPTTQTSSATPTLEEMAKQMEAEAAKKTTTSPESKPEEVKSEESKPDQANSEVKAEENKTSQPKAEEPKPEETKPIEPKAQEKSQSKESSSKDKKKEKEERLIKENTDPEVLDLVEDIREIADQFEDLNKSIEEDAQTETVSTDTIPTTSSLEDVAPVTPLSPTPQTSPTPDTTNPSEVPASSTSDNSTPKVVKQNIFKKIFARKKVDEKTESSPASPTIPTDPLVKPKKKKKLIFIIIISLLLALLIFIGISAVLAKSAYDSLRKSMTLCQEAVAMLKSQNLPEASEKLKEVHGSLQAAQIKYGAISYLRVVPYLGKFVSDGKFGLNAAVAGVEAGQILIDTINPYADLFGLTGEGSFTGGTTEERIALILSKMGEITPNLEQVSLKLEEVQTNLIEINPSDYPETFRDLPIRSYILQAQNLLIQANTLLSDAKPLLNVLPQVLGYPDTKKYMILFQNDGELRSTGGFMSAYSLVNVEKGKVVPESSNDIYHLDNQFKQVVIPPDFIKTHLNEKKLFLRNMNISPDFETSMSLFYENYSSLSEATQLDGIIAIDTYVLEKIVEIIGPVEVPGYGTFTTEHDDRCNLTQIVCELEYIIDKPLATVVSNRKADILGPMMKAILDKTFQGGNEQLGKLVPLSLDLLEQKHVQVYFTNETFQQAGQAFNITGNILDFNGDYLHINDSNLGGAKSNFYISQEVNSKIEITDDGSLKKTVEISYTHSEPADNCNLEKGDLCLSGIQRNYFRVYVPKGSVLEKGLGSQVEIRTGEELGKTYFEGFFELRPQSKAKVMLVYTLPFKLEGGNYKLLTQKQAGTRDVKHTIELSSGATQDFVLHKDTEIEVKL